METNRCLDILIIADYGLFLSLEMNDKVCVSSLTTVRDTLTVLCQSENTCYEKQTIKYIFGQIVYIYFIIQNFSKPPQRPSTIPHLGCQPPPPPPIGTLINKHF